MLRLALIYLLQTVNIRNCRQHDRKQNGGPKSVDIQIFRLLMQLDVPSVVLKSPTKFEV